MSYKEKCRYVRNISKEGFGFNLALRYIACFYTKIMKGWVKREAPGILIHYCRDWEYPWVLIASEIQPNYKVLDCGSGFSPLPFIWSEFGGEIYAIDKDAMICSPIIYSFYCFFRIVKNTIEMPWVVCKKIRQKELRSLISYLKPTNILARNWQLIRPIWKPDTWGPVSPRLLKKYKVNYQRGDLTSLPFENELFDVVSCVSVLEHMSSEDQIKGIREMARVVKNGGKLIITYDKREDLTDLFIEASGMALTEVVNFASPDKPRNRPEVVGMCLLKQKEDLSNNPIPISSVCP